MSKVAVVVGASKGIGLALAQRLASSGFHVYGTTRSATEALSGTVNVTEISGVDVSNKACTAVLKEALRDVTAIDLVVVNAGTVDSWTKGNSIDDIDTDAVENLMRVNTYGSVYVMQAVNDKLHAGAKVLLVTSRMGSIGDNGSGGSYAYRMTKAAMNQLGKNMSLELGPRGVSLVLIHPGMVDTSLIPNEYKSASISVDQCVDGMMKRISEISMSHNGTFIHAQTGNVLPW